jgi:hypothetical protein
MYKEKIPSLFHVGMPKSGSSFLYSLLKQHPRITMGTIQKINFYGANFQRGWRWYRSLFVPGPDTVLVDTSPKLFMYGTDAARRIKEYVRNPKFVLIFRNPVNYVYSHYRMHFNNGFFLKDHWDKFKRNPTFNEVIGKFPEYLRRGNYFEILQTWLKYFCLCDFKIIIFENFVSNPQETIGEICEFFNIENFRIEVVKKSSTNVAMRNPLFSKLKKVLNNHKKLKKRLQKFSILDKLYNFILTKPSGISEENSKSLEFFYRDDIKRLGDLLNLDLGIWSR